MINQYGELAHPNVNINDLRMLASWSDGEPGVCCRIAAARSTLPSVRSWWLVTLHLLAGLFPLKHSSRRQAVFPPKRDNGVRSTRSTADPLRRTTREEAPLLAQLTKVSAPLQD